MSGVNTVHEILRLAPTREFVDRSIIGEFLLSNKVGTCYVRVDHRRACDIEDARHRAPVTERGKVVRDPSSRVLAVLWVVCKGLGESGVAVYGDHSIELTNVEDPSGYKETRPISADADQPVAA